MRSRALSVAAVAIALAGCGGDDAPYSVEVRTFCSNATPPPGGEVPGDPRELARYAAAARRTGVERREGLRSRRPPAGRRAQVERLQQAYEDLDARYERAAARAGDRTALRDAERDAQALAGAAGLPECGPLSSG